MSDAINPQHYKAHPSGVEAIEVCEYLDFSVGNAVKYLWRAGKKPMQLDLDPRTALRQDLSKAAWYLRRAVDRLAFGPYPTRSSFLLCSALTRVLEHEELDSVLRNVLELTAQRIFVGNPPRLADALARVEQEIAALGS